jgi:deoxycytidylate deaminase
MQARAAGVPHGASRYRKIAFALVHVSSSRKAKKARLNPTPAATPNVLYATRQGEASGDVRNTAEGCVSSLHAEGRLVAQVIGADAPAWLQRGGALDKDDNNNVLLVTTCPCPSCCRMLVANREVLGLGAVVFGQSAFVGVDGVSVLLDADVDVYHCPALGVRLIRPAAAEFTTHDMTTHNFMFYRSSVVYFEYVQSILDHRRVATSATQGYAMLLKVRDRVCVEHVSSALNGSAGVGVPEVGSVTTVNGGGDASAAASAVAAAAATVMPVAAVAAAATVVHSPDAAFARDVVASEWGVRFVAGGHLYYLRLLLIPSSYRILCPPPRPYQQQTLQQRNTLRQQRQQQPVQQQQQPQ